MKATHQGTCQCCGNVQKLPRGRLSAHGYRVLWNSHVGVCPGAGELPYEQSCDLIERYVAAARAERERLVAWQAELRKPATWSAEGTELVAWEHIYRSSWSRRELNGYSWQQVAIRRDPKVERWYQYQHPDDGWRRLDGVYGAADLLDAATMMNAIRAKALDRDIAELDRYIAWQGERIADWRLVELAPIK